jgi:hypothetical protein
MAKFQSTHIVFGVCLNKTTNKKDGVAVVALPYFLFSLFQEEKFRCKISQSIRNFSYDGRGLFFKKFFPLPVFSLF